MKEKTKKVSFCGISGNGMSPLAQIMKLKGYDVRGSDRSFDLGSDQFLKKALENLGITIYPQDGSAITNDIETLYISTAVEADIPDIKVALEKNIPIVKRPDLLAEIFHQYTHNIAVAGTSGKTTTTAMIGYTLDILGLKPMMINGGLLRNYEDKPGIPNIIYNPNGDICVIEADESNGTIEKYHPYIGLINNIGLDHKSIDEVRTLFEDFASRCKYAVVVNADCPLASQIKHPQRKTINFSTKDKHADFYASDIKHLPEGVQYKLDGRVFKLNLIGEFNVANALAAISVCSLLGIDKFDVAKALEGFLGTKKRMEVIGKKKDITFIADFAHNPDKVLASVSALKNYDGRLIIMFQPHGFAPMKLTGKGIMESFAKTLGKQDILILPDILFVGGTVDSSISSKDLIDYGATLGLHGLYIPKREDVRKFILDNTKKGDRVVIMGARDNSLPDFAKELLESI